MPEETTALLTEITSLLGIPETSGDSGTTTTTTAEPLTEQEMFQQLDDKLSLIGDSLSFVCAFLALSLVVFVCRYIYRFFNMFF